MPDVSDPDIRYHIYSTVVATTRPPSTAETADHFEISVASVDAAYQRLADAHHIALAPGTSTIWMAHPFSGLPTNHVAEVDGQRYWGN